MFVFLHRINYTENKEKKPIVYEAPLYEMKFVKMNLFVFLQMEHFDLKQKQIKSLWKKENPMFEMVFLPAKPEKRRFRKDDLHRDIDI